MSKPDRSRKIKGPDPGEIGEFYESLQDLLRAYQFRDRNRACYHGISANQCYALELLEREEAVTVRALARHLNLAKSNVSRMTADLVERGLVRVKRDPSDGRSVSLRLTAAGTRLHHRIRESLQREQSELLREYSPEVRSSFSSLLRSLARSAKRR